MVCASVCLERVVPVAKIARTAASALNAMMFATGKSPVVATVVAMRLVPVSVTTCTQGQCVPYVHMASKARIAISTATTQRRAVGGVAATEMQNADAQTNGPEKAVRSVL